MIVNKMPLSNKSSETTLIGQHKIMNNNGLSMLIKSAIEFLWFKCMTVWFIIA